MTDPESPLIYSGSMLQFSEVHMLPVRKKEIARKGRRGEVLYAAFGSYAVLNSLMVLPPENSYQFLWTPTRDCVVWIGSVSYRDAIDDLISVFDSTGFGAARVSQGHIQAIATLGDMVGLVGSGSLRSELPTYKVSSKPLTISGDVILADALQLMFKGRIRRLFFDDDPSRFVSDRSILDLLFSPFMLKVARDSPAKWLDLRVGQIPKRVATDVPSGASLMEAASLLNPQSDDCLLTDNGRVVTRWDIVVKSWKKDLRVAPTPRSLVSIVPERSGDFD